MTVLGEHVCTWGAGNIIDKSRDAENKMAVSRIIKLRSAGKDLSHHDCMRIIQKNNIKSVS